MDTLHDPTLQVAADMVDDLEGVRIANENRVRQLLRSEADIDGGKRGGGLTETHPAVVAAQGLVKGTLALEHEAVLQLQRRLRAHPLGHWMKAQRGVGEKQGARLLAAIGDPYMRPDMLRADGTVEPARPRTVSELWSYAGMHVLDLPVDPIQPDAQERSVGGDPSSSDPGQAECDTQKPSVGVAASRRRGQRSNWNADARQRVYLVAAQTVKVLRKPCLVPDDQSWAVHVGGCTCGRWRVLYDASREKYADAIHRAPCVRCGPTGHPAPMGSPLSAGHQHARAVRIVAKTILKELWREAGRIHGADTSPPTGGQPTPILDASAETSPLIPATQLPTDTHGPGVAGDPDGSDPGQAGPDTHPRCAGVAAQYPSPPPTGGRATPIGQTSAGTPISSDPGQPEHDAHSGAAGVTP